MLGLPGGFARNFNMWGGVGWGVSTLVFMCTHVRCWCVDVYTWYVGWGGVCQRWCSCVHMVRCWCVDVYTWYVGWGGVCQRWCSCVHMVRFWCVDVYTWCAAGVFMCTHGTLLVCHVQTYHAIAVSCLIVHRFLILIGFNVFLLAMCLLSV